MFASALIPCLIAFVLRIFLKEPEKWKEESKGKSPSFKDLFSPELRGSTISAFVLVCVALVTWYCLSSFLSVIAQFLATQSVHAGEIAVSEQKALFDRYLLIISIAFNAGGLLGALIIIFLANRIGRINLFRIYFAGAGISILVAFGLPRYIMPDYLRIFLYFPVGVFCSGVFGMSQI